ncbi:DNA polymerase III subunit gamma/tau [Alteromonas sp. CYL-A6]|uniref:DNA polymerase III subunit gamma/tau n=1 Tax=Alteromonas nitratireducens TaxID=3390813 RepID=UPI0034B19130
MSYQVLARKWRPGKFSELVGQEHVVSAISNALDNDRLHHAYLFTGTRGVGKTTIARIFSKSLNCEEGQGANPCGQCATCTEIEQGNYVDLLEIDAASRTKVEDTRELLDNVQYKPTRGRYKVYLIDEVHMLSKHSFNALLKTLEEPPPHVKFLLATTDPQKLPVTILSRCLQFNLKALSREQITGQLEHILNAETIPFEASALGLLAKAAQGSMRDALSLTDQAIAQGNNQVTAQVVTDMLGLMDKNHLLKLINAVIKKLPQDVTGLIDAMAQQSPDYAQVLSELSSLFHQIALTQWVPDACKLETSSARAIYELSRRINPEQVQLFYQIALQGKRDLPYAPDGRAALEMTLLRMMTFAPASPVASSDDVISQAPVAVPAAASTTITSEASSEPDNSVQHPEQTVADSVEQPAPMQEVRADEADTPPWDNQAVSEAEQAPVPDNELPASVEQDDTFAPPFDMGPPPEAYNDDIPPQQDESEHSQPAYAEPEQKPANQEASLSATQEMLALRQKLKQSRQEAQAESAKKPEAPAAKASVLPLTSQQPADAENISPGMSPADDSEGAAAQSRHSAENPPAEPAMPGESDSNTDPNNVHEAHDTVTEQPVLDTTQRQKPIQAFLDNGEKLLHARQIDNWSNLVEAMPVAGLLKQLVLHSACFRDGTNVRLELDESQAHLLNESAVAQIKEALCSTLNEDITLVIEPGKPASTPFSLQQEIHSMRQSYAHEVIETDETIRAIMDEFEASVVPDSVKPC